MELWENGQDSRVSEVSSGKRDEILLLVDAGYSRSAISKQTGTAVDIIEHLLANRMHKANSSSDDDSDGYTAEQESAATPSVKVGTRDKRTKEAAERKELILKLFDENHKPKEIIQQLGLHRTTVQKILEASGRLDGSIKRRSTRTPQQEKAILQLFAQDVQQTEIAERVGVHRTTVHNVLKSAGKFNRDKKRRPIRTPQQEELIHKLSEKGAAPGKIAEYVGVHRNTVCTVLKSAEKPKKPARTQEQEDAILQLFAEGVSRDEIVRRVKMGKKTVTNVLLRYGKSFAQRIPRAKLPEPQRAIVAQRSAIRMLQKKGCAGAQIARHLGIDKIVRREIYLAQRTDRIISNIDGHQNSPEFPESRPNPSGSPTFPDESDVQDVAAVGIFEAATANSLSNSIRNSNSHSDSLKNPENISIKCADSALAGRRYRCDLCHFETHFEAAFISHVLGTQHAHLARRGVVVRCAACPFRTRQPNKMVGHAVTYQFHCLPDRADVYSIARSSS